MNYRLEVISHYELYLRAMDEFGADSQGMKNLISD